MNFAVAAGLPRCICDADQLGAASTDLVINARDTRSGGERLKIETADTVFDTEAAQLRGIAPGTYLVLAENPDRTSAVRPGLDPDGPSQ